MESHVMKMLLTNSVLRISLPFLTLVVAIVTIYLRFYKRSHKYMKLALQIPGPKRYPIIGTAYSYGTNSSDIFEAMIKFSYDFGPVSGHWIGPEFVSLIRQPADVEAILSSKSLIYKPTFYKFMIPWIGLGLISASGERWRKHRKLLTPTFHFKVLENYVNVFNRKIKIMLKSLESQVDNPNFDIQPYFNGCVFDIICESAMSTDLDSQSVESYYEFVEANKMATNTVLTRMFRPWLHPDIFFKYSATGKKQTKCLSVLQKIYFYGPKKLAFLDFLLRYAADGKNEFNDQDIQDEVKTFMAAGTDTTSVALGFIAHELSKRFEVQEKIVEEIKQELGSLEDKPFSYYELQNMKYLERVVKECLRLYPSVPFIARKITEDVSLPSGYTLPEGSTTLIVFYTLHRDPELFPNPDEFNLDHFLPERIGARHPYSYCPFSAGPRNCIGQKFAILKLKSVIISLLRKYWLLPTNDEVKFAAEVVLRSTTGVHVGLKRRTKERPII